MHGVVHTVTAGRRIESDQLAAVRKGADRRPSVERLLIGIDDAKGSPNGWTGRRTLGAVAPQQWAARGDTVGKPTNHQMTIEVSKDE